MNNVSLMGRIGKDLELKHTQNGIPVVSFSLAVQRAFKSQSGEQEVDWINIVAWRNTAEFTCKYFGKGDMIALKGAIQTRQYTDKEDNNRTTFEVVADNVYFTGSKSDSSKGNNTHNNQQQGYSKQRLDVTVDDGGFVEIVGDNELPFI